MQQTIALDSCESYIPLSEGDSIRSLDCTLSWKVILITVWDFQMLIGDVTGMTGTTVSWKSKKQTWMCGFIYCWGWVHCPKKYCPKVIMAKNFLQIWRRNQRSLAMESVHQRIHSITVKQNILISSIISSESWSARENWTEVLHVGQTIWSRTSLPRDCTEPFEKLSSITRVKLIVKDLGPSEKVCEGSICDSLYIFVVWVNRCYVLAEVFCVCVSCYD